MYSAVNAGCSSWKTLYKIMWWNRIIFKLYTRYVGVLIYVQCPHKKNCHSTCIFVIDSIVMSSCIVYSNFTFKIFKVLSTQNSLYYLQYSEHASGFEISRMEWLFSCARQFYFEIIRVIIVYWTTCRQHSVNTLSNLQ